MENNDNKILKQLEYYLSDKNLSFDIFFHNLISSSPDGFIEVDNFLNCNKIKEIKDITKEKIISIIKKSDELELNSDSTKVRRKNNKPLPELSLLNRKQRREIEKYQHKNKYIIILLIKSEKETEENWKNIENKFKELNPELNIKYSRFEKNIGHIAIEDVNNKEKINFIKSFELNNIKYSIEFCEGNNLYNFWLEHGNHLDYCLNNEKKNKNNNNNQKKNKNKYSTKLNQPLVLGDTIFNDISEIKGRHRKILSSTSGDELYILNDSDKKFILDLIKYHQDKDEILKKYEKCEKIGIMKKDPHNYSKFFFGVDKDNNKVFDFTVNKCIEKIKNFNNKKSK